MSILVSANNIRKSFGARPLFEKLTFVIESNEKIGLIGPNGAGKSTLLKMLCTELEVDDGEISFQRGIKIGYLTQSASLPSGLTVQEALFHSTSDEDTNETSTISGQVISRLELTPILYQDIDTLSGGWKKRVALAKELMKEPDLLLLDEPTNHLDVESIIWLEEFIKESKFAALIITHDRLFLQRVTERIIELDKRNPNGLLNIKGDYATYLDRKEELLSLQQKEETVLSNKLRRETEWLRRGPKARTTKQQARIQSAAVLKSEVEELQFRNQSKTASFEFQSNEKKPKRLIEAKCISKKYGDNILFQNLDLFIGPKSRIGLLGQNGSGKSSLIRILLGEEAPDTGVILRSDHLKVAYFQQNRNELNPLLTLRKTVCPYGDEVNYRGKLVHINGYLDRFLFRKEQFDMPLSKLSGGEQSRVLIAILMLNEANVLILDEPTNDLDVETLDVLQDCLTEFDGAVVLVTHDRYFLDQVASEIYAFPNLLDNSGTIISFAGLNQWEEWRNNQLVIKKAIPSIKKNDKVLPEKKRKLNFNETRELAGMEESIRKTDELLQDIQRKCLLPENISNAIKLAELSTELSKNQNELERLYKRWEELELYKDS